MNYIQRWKKTTIANQALVITGTLVAFSSLIYTGATVFQVYMWKQSAKQMGEQNDKLIAAAEQLAGATAAAQEDARKSNSEMLERAERITQANEKLANAAAKQADTSKTLAKAAESQADTSLISATAAKESAQSARETLRPYLTSQVWLTQFNKQEMEVTLVLVAGGSSPAKNVIVNYGFVIGDRDSSGCRGFESSGFKSGPFIILPQQQYPILIRKTLSEVELEATKNPIKSLFFCGKGLFSGVGGNYQFQVCGEYLPEFNSFSECSQ